MAFLIFSAEPFCVSFSSSSSVFFRSMIIVVCGIFSLNAGLRVVSFAILLRVSSLISLIFSGKSLSLRCLLSKWLISLINPNWKKIFPRCDQNFLFRFLSSSLTFQKFSGILIPMAWNSLKVKGQIFFSLMR